MYSRQLVLSDVEALKKFNKKPLSPEMLNYLVSITESIISIKKSRNATKSMVELAVPPLSRFIKTLVTKSKVTTATLMATSVYLTRLNRIIPKNSVYGIETTLHRIFLGCLIITSKSLHDSSPLNKHWARYASGLLQIREVNTIERELLCYLNWDLNISDRELCDCLRPFLDKIKSEHSAIQSSYPSPHSRSSSSMSIPSLVTMDSSLASSSSLSSLSPLSDIQTVVNDDNKKHIYYSSNNSNGNNNSNNSNLGNKHNLVNSYPIYF